MLIIIIANIIGAVMIGFFNINYLYSFEVAFFGGMAVFYSSYKSTLQKVQSLSLNFKKDSTGDKKSEDKSMQDTKDGKNDDFSISRKDRFFIGAKLSFGLFRIISYAFIAIAIIALINNQLFFIIPFLFGILICSFAMAFAISKNVN